MENQNKVKSVATYRYNKYFFEDIDNIEGKEGFLEKKIELDEAGNIVTESYFQESGEVDHKIQRVFNANNQLVEEFVFYADDEIAEKLIVHRNDKGQIIKKEKEYAEGEASVSNLKYDDNNNLISKVTLDLDGEVEEEENFVFENNNLIEHKIVNCFGNVQYFEKNKFNEKKQILEQIIENGDEYEKLIQFFEEDNLISLEIYDKQGNGIKKLDYTYNEINQNIEINERGKFGVKKIKIEYDEFGNEALEETYNAGGDLLQRIKRVFEGNQKNLITSYWIENKEYGIVNSFSVVTEYTYF
ncbi:MAG: hypothetical protein WCK02_15320 [Bacteroidota bacterium]